MPLVGFNTKTFMGEVVDCSPAARRLAEINYKLPNLQRMGLTDEEIAAVCKLDYLNAFCAKSLAKTKTP